MDKAIFWRAVLQFVAPVSGCFTETHLFPTLQNRHSQQYLECEHAQLVFGEGGARAVSFPIRKLCALLPLPRFAGLQPRLVQHVGLLASLWLPRDAASLVEFFQDAVELLHVRQNYPERSGKDFLQMLNRWSCLCTYSKLCCVRYPKLPVMICCTSSR